MPGRFVLALALAAACQSAAKSPPEGRASNEAVEIAAKAYTGKDEVKKLLGSELDGVIAVIDVRITPRTGGKLAVFRDDFTLRSDKDGQRSTPFAPSQIAGRDTLLVSSAPGGGGLAVQQGGPVWLPPMGGTPRRIGGDGAAVGNSSGEQPSSASLDTGGKQDPLLILLKERVLEDRETSGPLSGLLYFFLEGKHKPKDLELIYRGPAGRLSLRFKN